MPFVYITFAIKSNIIYKLYNYEVTEYYILFIYDCQGFSKINTYQYSRAYPDKDPDY